MFQNDFADFLESVVPDTNKLCFRGDVNIHWDTMQSRHTFITRFHICHRFSQTVSNVELVQHTQQSIYNRGHTLVFMITRANDELLSYCCVEDQISDHNSIHGYIKLKNRLYPNSQIA